MDTLNARRRSGGDRGSELIELAIVMPILVILLLGVVDFAFLFQRWEVVTNSAREGARLGSMASADTPGGYTTTDVEDRVESYLASGGLTATPNILVNFDTNQTIGTTTVQTITVSVRYPSDFLFLPGSINLTSVSEMRSENEQ